MATEAEQRQRAINFVNLVGNITINKVKAGEIQKGPAVEKMRVATRKMGDPATKLAMQAILQKMIDIPDPGIPTVEPTIEPMIQPTIEPTIEPTPEPIAMMDDTEAEEPMPEPTVLAPDAAPITPGAPVPFQQPPMALAEEKDPFSKTWVLAIPIIVAMIPFLLGRS